MSVAEVSWHKNLDADAKMMREMSLYNLLFNFHLSPISFLTWKLAGVSKNSTDTISRLKIQALFSHMPNNIWAFLVHSPSPESVLPCLACESDVVDCPRNGSPICVNSPAGSACVIWLELRSANSWNTQKKTRVYISISHTPQAGKIHLTTDNGNFYLILPSHMHSTHMYIYWITFADLFLKISSTFLFYS